MVPIATKRSADRMMRDFGRRLRAARITAGYDDASEFASDLGIEAPRYRKYERGQSMPKIDILAAIIDITGRDLNWLILGRAPDDLRENGAVP